MVMTATPTPDPAILKAIERLDYRATVGDVASQIGLEINLAERGLLALASEAGGTLEVAESGEVIYSFPKNFRDILRNKSLRMRLSEWWEKVWRVLFYLIRISFGIILILLIVLAIAAIIIITVAATSSNDDNDSDRGWGSGGGIWVVPDFGWIFYSDYDRRPEEIHPDHQTSNLNFLEAVFSFLFGDGNPNADLEETRWQTIAAVIRNNQGAVIAEQVAPYLDTVGQGFDQEYENYMLPVLTRFDGRPEVSPEGQLVYQFPSLQTTVAQSTVRAVPPFLREALWQFSQAGKGQLTLAAGLGVVLLGLSGWLTLIDGGVAIFQTLAIASFAYSSAFLTIPTVRYFWLKRRNWKVRDRNHAREQRATLLAQKNPTLEQKLAYAKQFATETVIQDSDLIYTTERDLTAQESQQQERLDAEWRNRLEGMS
jgi:hypothetical protein